MIEKLNAICPHAKKSSTTTLTLKVRLRRKKATWIIIANFKFEFFSIFAPSTKVPTLPRKSSS